MVVENPDNVAGSEAEPCKPPAQVRSARHPVILILQVAVLGAAIVVGGLGVVYLMERPPARRIPPKDQVVGNSSSGARADVTPGEEVAIENDSPQEFEASTVPRGRRWVFEFAPDQTEEEYARMLDALNIELATPASSNAWAYASNFTSTPIHHTALARQENRIFTSWSNTVRRKFDIDLLRKAGVKVSDDAVVIQLHPKDVVNRLARLEYNFKRKQPIEIRRTRFKVISAGNTFDFVVTAQEPLRRAPVSPASDDRSQPATPNPVELEGCDEDNRH